MNKISYWNRGTCERFLEGQWRFTVGGWVGVLEALPSKGVSSRNINLSRDLGAQTSFQALASCY